MKVPGPVIQISECSPDGFEGLNPTLRQCTITNFFLSRSMIWISLSLKVNLGDSLEFGSVWGESGCRESILGSLGCLNKCRRLASIKKSKIKVPPNSVRAIFLACDVYLVTMSSQGRGMELGGERMGGGEGSKRREKESIVLWPFFLFL